MIDLDELRKLAEAGLAIEPDSLGFNTMEAYRAMQDKLDFATVLDLIERVRRAENARDGWASNAMEYANAIKGAEVLLARIAEVAKLHQPESFHDEPIESFCKTCQRTSGVWPCGTAIALGLNEGENTDV